jgi:hypothetical protein
MKRPTMALYAYLHTLARIILNTLVANGNFTILEMIYQIYLWYIFWQFLLRILASYFEYFRGAKKRDSISFPHLFYIETTLLQT